MGGVSGRRESAGLLSQPLRQRPDDPGKLGTFDPAIAVQGHHTGRPTTCRKDWALCVLSTIAPPLCTAQPLRPRTDHHAA
jgi:hypothetical protein